MIVHQFLIILAPHGLERVLLPLHHGGSLRGCPLSTLCAADLLIPLLMFGVPPTYGLLADNHLGLTEFVLIRCVRGLHLRCDPVLLLRVLMSVEDSRGALAEAAGVGEEVGFALPVAAEGVRVEGGALRWLVFGGPHSKRARVLHGTLEEVMGDGFVREE